MATVWKEDWWLCGWTGKQNQVIQENSLYTSLYLLDHKTEQEYLGSYFFCSCFLRWRVRALPPKEQTYTSPWLAQMSVLTLSLSCFYDLWNLVYSSCSQTSKSKQRMLKEDWEFFKQRKFIEEQVCLLDVALDRSKHQFLLLREVYMLFFF